MTLSKVNLSNIYHFMKEQMSNNENKFMRAERRRYEKLRNLRLLPSLYKKIGLGLAILAFSILLITKASGIELGDLKFIVRSFMLFGLLLVTISKDAIEDELTLKLRGQAFIISFIFGVLYTIVRPFIDFSIGSIFNTGFDPNGFSSFELILVMLMIQIMFYHLSKKMR